MCARHTALQEALVGLLKDDGLAADIEQSLTTAAGTTMGRADVSWTNHSGRTTHADIAVVSATTPTALKASSATRDAAAACQMEEAKMRKYASSRVPVAPLIFEAGGRLGPLALKVLRGSFRSPQDLSSAYQTLTAVLVRANAATIMKATRAWMGWGHPTVKAAIWMPELLTP